MEAHAESLWSLFTLPRSVILFAMTIDALIMFSGAFIAVLPFLGFPIKWDSILMVAAGIIVIALGIIVRRRGLGRKTVPNRANGSTYVENSPQPADTHEAA